MQITPSLLQQMEQNTALKKQYINAGSYGGNKMMILPIVIAVASLFGAYELHDMAHTDSSYNTYMMVCIAVAAICIIAIALMQRNAKTKTAAGIDGVPICIAKKIYGNDAAGIYYGIYATGPKRHDIEFIESVAYRIFNINLENDTALKNKIDQMFGVKFAEQHAIAVRLPDAISNGEEVYQRQFSFNTIANEMKNTIAENEDRFIVLAFNKTNAVLVKDISPYAS